MQFSRNPLDGAVLVAYRPRQFGCSGLALRSLGEMGKAVFHHKKLTHKIDQRIDLRLIDAKTARNGTRRGLRIQMNVLLATIAGAKRGTARQRSQRLVENGDKGCRVSLRYRRRAALLDPAGPNNAPAVAPG